MPSFQYPQKNLLCPDHTSMFDPGEMMVLIWVHKGFLTREFYGWVPCSYRWFEGLGYIKLSWVSSGLMAYSVIALRLDQ